MQISGCSAIVTGGTGGMGEATVRRLHAAGARVVVADVADEKGKALERELGVRYVHADAGPRQTCSPPSPRPRPWRRCGSRSTCMAARPPGGRLLGKDGSPMGLEGFRTTLESYLVSFFNVMRLAAAAIARSEPTEDGGAGGHHQYRVDRRLRGADRAASLRGGQGRDRVDDAGGGSGPSPTGIRVVTIAPGTILTPAYGKAGDQLEAYWGPQVPHPKRMGRPAEYAALVQAIAENDYLNGEVIRLDGALRFPPK